MLFFFKCWRISSKFRQATWKYCQTTTKGRRPHEKKNTHPLLIPIAAMGKCKQANKFQSRRYNHPLLINTILALLTTYHTYAAGSWSNYVLHRRLIVGLHPASGLIDSTAESANYMSTRYNHVGRGHQSLWKYSKGFTNNSMWWHHNL